MSEPYTEAESRAINFKMRERLRITRFQREVKRKCTKLQQDVLAQLVAGDALVRRSKLLPWTFEKSGDEVSVACVRGMMRRGLIDFANTPHGRVSDELALTGLGREAAKYQRTQRRRITIEAWALRDALTKNVIAESLEDFQEKPEDLGEFDGLEAVPVRLLVLVDPKFKQTRGLR